MSIFTAVQKSLRLLTNRDRRRLFFALLIQVTLSALDVIGILLIGLVGALAVSASQGGDPPAMLVAGADAIGLESTSDSTLLAVCALAAAISLLVKSALSSLLLRRVLFFLANRQATLTGSLARSLFNQPLTTLQQRSSQQTAFALLSGAGAATLQILGQSLLALTEAALLLAIATTLIWVNPLVALASIAFFGLVGVSLQAILGHRSSQIGVIAAETEIESLQAIQEAMGAYREISVAQRRGAYVGRIEKLRFTAARMTAEGQFIGIFPKYLFEVALVVGGLLLAAFLFNTQPFEVAVAQFALFIAAATRVMPSILRLQGSAIILRGSASVARHAYELAESLEGQESLSQVSERQDTPDSLNNAQDPSTFSASLSVKKISFWYPNQDQAAVSEVSFSSKAGERLAIVGRSGAGKSTLADLILGILNPAEGEILIGGSSPSAFTKEHPGAVAYVPQSVLLANATIRENVALGLGGDSICDDLVWEALRGAHLSEIVEASKKGIETIVGEGGYKLSGGQRQRLGIARALYTRPRLLVLDEATSSLDVETESEIEASMSGLDQDVTVVTIAHRLSTIRSATTILYLEQGRLRAIGSFAQVRESIPEFDRQLNMSFIN